MQKAVVYKHPWGISIEENPLRKINSNEVLVRIRATGICGTDLSIISGKYHAKPQVILGHESAGEFDTDIKGALNYGLHAIHISSQYINVPANHGEFYIVKDLKEVPNLINDIQKELAV